MLTQTTWQVAGGYTQTTLADAIKAALEPVLGAVVDDYTASNIRNLVFKPLAPADADYNRLFLRIAVNASYNILAYVSDAWNAGTHAGTRESAGKLIAIVSATSSAINFALFRSSEAVLLCAQQGAFTKGFAGALKLLDTPPWWNTGTFHPWLVGDASFLAMPSGSNNNPFNQTGAAYINGYLDELSQLSTENPLTARRALMAGGIGIYSTYAYFGRLSDDFGYVASASTSIFDTFTTNDTPAQTWVSLDGATSRALVGRTA